MSTKTKLQSVLLSLYAHDDLIKARAELTLIDDLASSAYIEDLSEVMGLSGEDVVYYALAEDISQEGREEDDLIERLKDFARDTKKLIKHHDKEAVKRQKEICAKGKAWLDEAYKKYMEEDGGFAPPPEWNPIFN